MTEIGLPAPREPVPPEQLRLRASLQRLSWWMDDSIRLPTGHRIGFDGLIGLIPGIGDLLGAAVSGYFLVQSARLGVSKAVIARMAFNVVFEALIGAIPLLGDVFDFAFKANARNYRLLEDSLDRPSRVQKTSTAFVGTVVLAAFLVLLLAAVGLVALAYTLWTALFG